MSRKGIIIGSFVKKTKILSFLENLKYVFGIDLSKVFVYSIDSNNKEYLVTFKSFNKDKFANKLFNFTIMHVKNNCLFSINAINKLIEQEYNHSGDKENNEIELNWDLYKNKLIILAGGELKINDLTKIEDKCHFLS